jgi:hypothetical protein
MLRHAISCYVMLYHVVILRHAISCYVMLYHVVMLRHAISCYVMLYHVVMLRHAISCYVMLYHVISCCYVTSCRSTERMLRHAISCSHYALFSESYCHFIVTLLSWSRSFLRRFTCPRLHVTIDGSRTPPKRLHKCLHRLFNPGPKRLHKCLHRLYNPGQWNTRNK